MDAPLPFFPFFLLLLLKDMHNACLTKYSFFLLYCRDHCLALFQRLVAHSNTTDTHTQYVITLPYMHEKERKIYVKSIFFVMMWYSATYIYYIAKHTGVRRLARSQQHHQTVCLLSPLCLPPCLREKKTSAPKYTIFYYSLAPSL